MRAARNLCRSPPHKLRRPGAEASEPVYDLPGGAQRPLRDGMPGAVRSGWPGYPPAPQRRRPPANATAEGLERNRAIERLECLHGHEPMRRIRSIHSSRLRSNAFPCEIVNRLSRAAVLLSAWSTATPKASGRRARAAPQRLRFGNGWHRSPPPCSPPVEGPRSRPCQCTRGTGFARPLGASPFPAQPREGGRRAAPQGVARNVPMSITKR